MEAHKNQYLKEMGIDVWVPRRAGHYQQAPVQAETPSEPGRGSVPVSATQHVVAEEPVRAKSSVVVPPAATPFHLCFASYDSVSLIFSIPQSATLLPPDYRRFADDIGLALTGKADPVISALRWPMVQSAHIDQSDAAAGVVISQRLDRCAPARIVMGPDVATLTMTGEKRGAGVRVLLVDALARYLAEPSLKRELWQALSAFRREMQG